MKMPKIPMSQEQLIARARHIEELAKNPTVQSFLKRTGLPESILNDYSSYFDDWLETEALCKNCPGLRLCPMPVAGKMKKPALDQSGFLIEAYFSCSHLQEKEAAQAHKKYFLISDMEDEDYEIDLGKLPRASSAEYTAAVMALAKSRDANNQVGVYLFGQPGTGKSTLAMALANAYAKAKTKVGYVKMPQLIQSFKQNSNDEDFRQSTLWKLKNVDVLFLDDLGSEFITAWSRDEILFPILEERMIRRRKTYFTSNCSLQELADVYGSVKSPQSRVAMSRLMDRISAMSLPVPLRGNSRRHHPDAFA